MTPSRLVSHAKDSGLSAIALTDHDSISGVAEAVEEGKKTGVEVIPAVELSAVSDTETHILGYFIDINNRELQKALEYAKQVRYEREVETCRKLNELGFDITMEEVEAEAETDILCRAHFAKVMVKKGYAPLVKEAFEQYLNVGKSAYSKKQALTDIQAVELINNAGGIAFLAHLHLTKKPLPELKEFLIKLKNAGLAGVEGYYTDYTPQMERDYQSLAEESGLILSGGTDFHGAFKPHIAIGRGYGNLEIPYVILEKMKEYRQSRNSDFAFRSQRKDLV